MNSGTLYGLLVVHASLTQLVFAALINPIHDDLKNNSITTNLTEADPAFDENVKIFINAVDKYKILLHPSFNTQGSRFKQGFPAPSSLMKALIIPEKDVDEITRDISMLKNSFPVNAHQEMNNLTALQTSIDSLLEVMKNQNDIILKEQGRSEVNEKIEYIIETLKLIKAYLEIILARQQEEFKRRILDDIVHHIQSDEFSLAAHKLENATGGDYIYVVMTVYSNRAENLGLLLRFSDAVLDAGQKLKIYNATFNEMKIYGHTNFQMLTELSKRIKSEIVDKKTGSSSIEAQSLLDKVCTHGIVRHLQSNQLQLVQQGLQMGNNHTYVYAVRQVYHHLGDPFSVLVRFAKFVQQIEVKLKLYKALYYEMSSNDRNDKEKLLQLAECIKTELIDRDTGAVAAEAQSLLDMLCIDDTKRNLQSNGENVVSKICNLQVGSFEALLRLANSEPDAEKKLKIYEALYNEMVARGRNDSQMLSQLKQSIKTTIIEPTNGAVGRAAQSLIDRIIHNEIIDLLKSLQFPKAGKLLDTTNDDGYVSVVKQMYKQEPDSFNLMISFADFMLNSTSQVKVFQVLYKVMRTDGRNDAQEQHKLIESIKAWISLGPKLLTNNTVAQLQVLLNHIYYDDIIDHLKSGEFASAEKKLINRTDDVFRFVVKEMHPEQEINFNIVRNFAKSILDLEVKSKLVRVFYELTKDPRIPIELYPPTTTTTTSTTTTQPPPPPPPPPRRPDPCQKCCYYDRRCGWTCRWCC